MHDGRCGNCQIERATAWLATTLSNRCMQSPALACRGGVEGQRIEVLLDDPQAAQAARAGVVVGSYQDSEVQLGQRDDADRRVPSGV